MPPRLAGSFAARLAAFQAWLALHPFSHCRLVQYSGVDLVGAMDVEPSDVEAQIAGLLAEGFRVDWLDRDQKLFLRIWEGRCPEPGWDAVLAARPLADVAAILKSAGFQTAPFIEVMRPLLVTCSDRD